MKIIVFAEENISHNHITYLDRKGVQVLYISKLFQDTLMKDKQSLFDLAVVDSSSRNAAKAYHYFEKIWSLPVIFLIDSKVQEWDEIRLFSPVGYISKKAGAGEFFTRLMAIYRRLSMKSSPTEPSLDNEPIISFDELNSRYLPTKAQLGAPVRNPVWFNRGL